MSIFLCNQSIFHRAGIGQSAAIGEFCIAVGSGLHRNGRLDGVPILEKLIPTFNQK